MMADLESSLSELGEPYYSALQTALIYIEQRFEPLGIIVSGSIIRGNPGPTSDFDIFVIHDQPFRQRVQKRFNGVPAEIFVNNPAAVRAYFVSEYNEGRPCTAHMLTTGVVLLNRDLIVETLVAEAKEWNHKRPEFSDTQLVWKRYAVVDALDNAKDLIENDPANAQFFLHEAVQAMVNYAFLAIHQKLPRFKEILTTLEQNQPTLGGLVRSYYGANDAQQQLALAEQIAQLTIGTTEFFEWESTPEVYPHDQHHT